MQSAWCIKSALFLLQCHKSLQVTSVIMPRKFRHYRPKCSEKKRALYYIIRVNKKLARDDSSAIKVKFHLYYEKRGLNIPHRNRTELKSYIRRNARIMYCAHTVSNPFPSTIYACTHFCEERTFFLPELAKPGPMIVPIGSWFASRKKNISYIICLSRTIRYLPSRVELH